MKRTDGTFLSPKQAALKIGVSLVTLYRYLNLEKNPLPAYKITGGNVRILQDELTAWVLSHRMKETIEEEGLEHYE